MSLRRPNFDRPPSLPAWSRGGGFPGGTPSAAAGPAEHRLADYTRQCHRRLLRERDDAAARLDDEPEHDDGGRGHGMTAAGQGGNDGSNAKKKDDPSLEQCVVLLEPTLKLFQDGCAKRDRARAKQAKKGKRKSDAEESEWEGGPQEEDEVPPQLLRLARFFQYRWLPMKRALLRPPPSSRDVPTDGAPDVELNLHYRLRLARACWKKGLLAAAEYEALKGAWESKGEKRKGAEDADGDTAKRCKTDNARTGEALVERVRLALLRLPTEAVRPERAAAAWRHAREMLLECARHWEKQGDGTNLHGGENALDALTPSQVADWALTSWTALLLSRGVDSLAIPTSHHASHARDPAASVEGHLAALLSDRSTANNPTRALAVAVASRIDELLSPNNIGTLNGVHLFSLGRLLASFRSREDAEGHIVQSIASCSSVGGMAGLEQLSKLLAVYSSCIAANASVAESSGGMAHGRTAVKEMEARIRASLDSNGEGVDCAEKLVDGKPRVLPGAKSYLDAVFCATGHLVKTQQRV